MLRFVRLLLPFVVAVIACIMPVASAAATASVAPDAFFRHPDHADFKLSPSGKYLAGLVPVQGRVRLSVLDLDAKTASVVGSVDGEDVATFEWVNDRRLVFSAMDLQAGLGEQRGGGLYAINRDGTESRVLAPTVRQLIARGQVAPRYTALHGVLRDGSADVMVIANDRSVRYPGIYRMDTLTAKKTWVGGEVPGDVVGWVVDRKGVARAAVTEEKKGLAARTWWRPTADAAWVALGEYGLAEPHVAPVAFDGDGSLIVAANQGRDTLALYHYDTDKKTLGNVLAAHPQADLNGGLRFDRKKNAIVGLVYDGMKPGSAWFDDDWARAQVTIDKALPGRMNVLQASEDGARILVLSYSDTDPGTYYLYDRDQRRLEFVAASRKAIDPARMPAREPVRYAARDGLEIPAYVTLPMGAATGKLPLVVLVHGGPNVRGGHWRWNAEAAYLASLGYAVLEPEFRGSLGWGRKHFEAGWKQWGLAMQDDLDDGVDWLAKQGTIDPKRVCIMGGSYGGYAVMLGLARNPERWRCGINFIGVTDINLLFEVGWSDFADSNYLRYAAKDLIGDPVKDAAQFKATSPLAQAARIKAPVLMAYGTDDRRVPLIHGEEMRDALRKQGTPVEWVAYVGEGHGFLVEANRIDFYTRVAKFLDAHLGAKAP